MDTFIKVLIAVGACTGLAAAARGWQQVREDREWPWWLCLLWTPIEAVVVIGRWLAAGARWSVRNGGPVAAHRSHRLGIWWRNRRASWSRWQAERADRHRPVPAAAPVAGPRPIGADGRPIPAGERFGNIGDPDVQRAMAQGGRIIPPRGRTVAMPHPAPAGPRSAAPAPAGAGPAAAPAAGGSFGAPAGGAPNALGPFAAPIEWIASRDPEDSDEFESDLKTLFDGWLGMGEAFEQFAETCAESGIGLDPVVIRSILDLAGQVSENGEATVRVKKVLDAVYEGFREWAATHRPTKDGRWIQPESGAGPQAPAA